MTALEISERLRSKFGDALLEVKAEGVPDPFVKVKQEALSEVSRFLRTDGDLSFDFLMCLSGVDLGKNTLGVVYNLYSMTKRHKITVKVELPAEKPEVHSVVGFWPSALWHEREAYDLVGVVFSGHPDLRRILLPEDYPGHPLRKDFKVPEFYGGMKVPY